MKPKSEKNSLLAIFLFFLATSFYFYEFLLQVIPNALTTELMSKFQVNATDLGILTSLYFIGYASMQIPAGLFIDRYGPRRLLTIAASICAIGTIIFGAANNFWLGAFARFCTGFGSAFALVGVLVIATRWFKTNLFSFLSGLAIMVGMLGAIVGVTIISFLFAHFNWQHTVETLGLLGIILAIIMLYTLRDFPANYNTESIKENSTDFRDMFRGLWYVIKRGQSWLAALYGGFMFAPTAILGALWGISFFASAYPISKADAGGLVSLIFLGWAIGSPSWGAVSDYHRKRKPPMYAGAVLGLICSLIIIYVPNLPIWLLAGLLLIFGFFSSGFITAFATIRELQPIRFSGTAVGFMNMMNTMGAATLPLLISVLLDYHWLGLTGTDGSPVYNLHNFHFAMSIIPACFVISLILCFFIKETNCETVI